MPNCVTSLIHMKILPHHAQLGFGNFETVPSCMLVEGKTIKFVYTCQDLAVPPPKAYP